MRSWYKIWRSAADPPDVPRCSRSRIHPDDDSHAGGRTLGKTARHLPCSSLPGTFPRRDRRSLSDRCGGRDFCPRGALHERFRTVRSVGSDRLQKCQPWQMRPGVPSPLFCKGSKKRVYAFAERSVPGAVSGRTGTGRRGIAEDRGTLQTAGIRCRRSHCSGTGKSRRRTRPGHPACGFLPERFHRRILHRKAAADVRHPAERGRVTGKGSPATSGTALPKANTADCADYGCPCTNRRAGSSDTPGCGRELRHRLRRNGTACTNQGDGCRTAGTSAGKAGRYDLRSGRTARRLRRHGNAPGICLECTAPGRHRRNGCKANCHQHTSLYHTACHPVQRTDLRHKTAPVPHHSAGLERAFRTAAG